MTAVAPEGALSLPPAFVAVTTTRTVLPTSTGTRSYVAAVAPVMSAQLAPAASQRCHWCAKEIAGVPVHVPSPAVSVCVSVVVPVTDGAAVFAGGAGTTACGAEA